MKLSTLLAGAAALAFSAMVSTASIAADTVVLVHGAFADGSSWNKVIPILQDKGYKTIAVQSPMTSLQDDVAVTKRAIANAEGNVILVGHSWGGMIITEAGVSDKVKSLVYVAAFAPEKGEHIHDILDDAHGEKKIPAVPGFKKPNVDKAGYITLPEETVITYFAPDIPESDAKLIAAGQGPLHKDALDQVPNAAAWKVKPSWFVVSTNDQMLAPGVQSLMAERAGSKVTEIPASHVVMLSNPEAVANVILEAGK